MNAARLSHKGKQTSSLEQSRRMNADVLAQTSRGPSHYIPTSPPFNAPSSSVSSQSNICAPRMLISHQVTRPVRVVNDHRPSATFPTFNGAARPPGLAPSVHSVRNIGNSPVNVTPPSSVRRSHPHPPLQSPASYTPPVTFVPYNTVPPSLPHSPNVKMAPRDTALQAPPGLPAPKIPVEGEYSTEGLFTPEQEVHANQVPFITVCSHS